MNRYTSPAPDNEDMAEVMASIIHSQPLPERPSAPAPTAAHHNQPASQSPPAAPRRHAPARMAARTQHGLSRFAANSRTALDSRPLNQALKRRSAAGRNTSQNTPAGEQSGFPKRYVVIPLAGLLLLAGIGTGVYVVFNRNNTGTAHAAPTPFNQQVQASASAHLYYFKTLPAGYKTDSNSTSQPADGVTIYSVTNSKGQTVYLSQQKLPENFDMNAFLGKMTDQHAVQTSAGTAAVGTVSSSLVGTLVTDEKNWLIVNTSAPIEQAEFEALVKGLAKS